MEQFESDWPCIVHCPIGLSQRILMYSEASFQQVKTKEVMGHHLSQAGFALSLS